VGTTTTDSSSADLPAVADAAPSIAILTDRAGPSRQTSPRAGRPGGRQWPRSNAYSGVRRRHRRSDHFRSSRTRGQIGSPSASSARSGAPDTPAEPRVLSMTGSSPSMTRSRHAITPTDQVRRAPQTARSRPVTIRPTPRQLYVLRGRATSMGIRTHRASDVVDVFPNRRHDPGANAG
jgi:hypothetical protein